MKIHVADPQHVHANWHHPMPAGWQSYYLKTEVDAMFETTRTLTLKVVMQDVKIATLEVENKRLEGIVSEVHSWIVCAAITTPEDMAGNFDRIAEITTPKDDEL